MRRLDKSGQARQLRRLAGATDMAPPRSGPPRAAAPSGSRSGLTLASPARAGRASRSASHDAAQPPRLFHRDRRPQVVHGTVVVQSVACWNDLPPSSPRAAAPDRQTSGGRPAAGLSSDARPPSAENKLSRFCLSDSAAQPSSAASSGRLWQPGDVLHEARRSAPVSASVTPGSGRMLAAPQ